MSVPGPTLTITDEDFRKFRDYFYRHAGIYFEDSKRYFVDKRLLERIQRTGSEHFRDYFMMLRFDAGSTEMQELINCMTVNETYFFREPYQFECLVNDLLNEIHAHRRRGDTLKIWSIPCSSGEEPYSIAMYLLERWPLLAERNVEIVAGDIDTRMLAHAERGIYEQRSVQHLPPEYLEKYFTKLPGSRFQISSELRESVTFQSVNLNSKAQTLPYRDVDVIFCRNLLIYFDDVSRRLAADTLYEALRPGGFVCLGHSESMSRMSSLFKVRKFPDAIVYQRE